MKIATWNVNSVRARLERALAWLDKVQPDLVCLQEVKCQQDVFPRDRFEERGYHVEVHGQKTYNGVALLSREKPVDVGPIFPLAEDTAARGIAATVGGIRVVDLYVPNGKEVGSESYDYKLRWLDGLERWLVENHRPSDPLILTGDFNIAPDDRDVWDVELWRDKVLCSEPERSRFQRLLGWGLTDALRRFTDAPAQYTWWDYRGLGFQKRQGLRIDHFLATDAVMARATGVTIDRDERRGEGASDHAPVVLELSDAESFKLESST